MTDDAPYHTVRERCIAHAMDGDTYVQVRMRGDEPSGARLLHLPQTVNKRRPAGVVVPLPKVLGLYLLEGDA